MVRLGGHRPSGIDQSGFAHLVVLLVTLLLTAIAAAFVVDARSLAQGSRLDIDLAQVRLLADGLAREAFFAAVAREGQYSLKPTQSFTLQDGSGRQAQVRTLVEDESVKLDLNRSAPQALQSGFVARAGLPETKAAALVSNIVAMRQREGLSKISYEPLQSGESVLALRQSRAMDGKAFDSIEGLKQVPGMTAETYRALKPHVTVYGRPALLASATGGQGSGAEAERLAARIQVTVSISQGPIFTRDAVFSYPTANPGQYRVEKWQRGSAF